MATKAEPEEEELGDVEPEVWKGEWEDAEKGAMSPGLPPQEHFMTLPEAENKLHKNVWDYIRDTVWKSVVLIRVPTGPEPKDFDNGTGFVFFVSENKKQVMTNYHVVKNHAVSSPIRVRFFYNEKDSQVVECEAQGGPVYYSCKGKKGVDEKHLDFAVLDVKDIPDDVTGIDLSNSLCYYPPEYNKMHMEEQYKDNIPPKMSMTQGVIVGHPGGRPKRVSIVNFQFQNPNDIKRKYSQEGTWPGSSGSPVLLNFKQSLMGVSPNSFLTLHYGCNTIKDNGGKRRISSVGVNIFKVVLAIWEELSKQQQKMHMTLAEAKEKLYPKVWAGVKSIWDNVVHIKTSTGYGTGFVFRGCCQNEKLIMTNHYVLTDHDSKLPIFIRFFYDSLEDTHEDSVQCEFTGEPMYYSYDGTEHGRRDPQDFAVLRVEGIPGCINGFCLHCSLHQDTEPQVNVNEGFIIGHTRGGPKCICTVKFKLGPRGNLELRYSQAEQGFTFYESETSGSPLIISTPQHPCVQAVHCYKDQAIILVPEVMTQMFTKTNN